MNRRVLNIVVSLIVAGLFIWFAIRNVELGELWREIWSVSYWWLPFFLVVLLISHYLRAERWRLLLSKENGNLRRSTLFAGVMMGYFFNNLVPRLGEVTRPVYVAKQHNLSSSNLIGTIVIERLIDLLTMMFLILFALIWLVSDVAAVQKLFGTEDWSWYVYLLMPLFFILAIGGTWLVYRMLTALENRSGIESPVLLKIVEKARSFSEGILSIRHVQNWGGFILLTAGIWFGYVLMAYLPFFMMSMQDLYGLTMADAVVLTMVSSIGVSIPTPAGIGSYHLLIQQSMWGLYDVPLVKALTYATVAHGATVLSVFLFGPLALWWDKYYTLNSADSR
ncbi:MAG: flippase-like domain-containing protein [Balneolaceae bacterium]|nr:flippase-like domain-containing protein [Balneolaceae bacterium]MCH8548413.1 flippase-like domain-containing protein [Balneolaceae bacterium]